MGHVSSSQYIRACLICALCINGLSALLCADAYMFWFGMRFVCVLLLSVISLSVIATICKSFKVSVLILFASVIVFTQYRIPVWLLLLPAIVYYRHTLSLIKSSVVAVSYKDIAYALGFAAAILSVRQFTTPYVGLLRYTLSQHTDTVHHAAFSEMIGNFGVVSTGMNGLVETPYHVLSHRIVYVISRLAFTDSFTAYPFVLILIYLPVLAVLSGRLLQHSNIVKSMFFTFGTTLVAVKLFRGAYISDVFLSSESEVLALILLVTFITPWDSMSSKQAYSGLVSMSLSLLATLAKGPIGVILWLAESIRVLVVMRKVNVGQLLIHIVGLAALIVAMLYVAKGNSGTVHFGFMPFPKHIATGSSWMSFSGKMFGDGIGNNVYLIEYMLGHYILSLGTIAFGFLSRVDMRNNLWITLTVSTAIGIVLDLLVDLGGPNNYWITCVQFFLSIVVIASLVIRHKWSNRYSMASIVAIVVLVGIPNYRLKIEERSFQTDQRLARILSVVDNTRESDESVVRDDMLLAESLQRTVPDWKTTGLYFPAFSGKPWTNVIPKRANASFIGWTYDFYQTVNPMSQELQLNRNLRNLSVRNASDIK